MSSSPPRRLDAPAASLADRACDPGFTPSIRNLGGLLELVSGPDEELAAAAARAVLRIETPHRSRIASETASLARAAVRPARGRLTALAGRLAEEPAARAWVLEALADADPKTRRSAARALGKLERAPEIVAALEAAFARAESEDDKKPLAEALGRMGVDVGGTKRASLIAERERARSEPGAIDVERAADRALRIRFHLRSGLEEIVRAELGADFGAIQLVAPGVLEATLPRRAPLARALAVRTATGIGFPLEPFDLRSSDELAEAIATRLSGGEAQSIFRAFTDPREAGSGKIRFRLAFARGGLPRALAWKVAELVRADGGLLNDPRQSTWEVIVDPPTVRPASAEGGVRSAEGAKTRRPARLELVPHAPDVRFAYRQDHVAASSHPTIAAALARFAPRRDDDVVWDPFCGAGTELVERARLGPFARMVGTDRDGRAIAAARANLGRSELPADVRARIQLEEGDALAYPIATGEVTLVLTNPPMGRRVERGGHLELLASLVDRAHDVLAPGGALVWLVPNPKQLRAHAESRGFSVERAITVDMGGFPAELSLYRRQGPRGREGREARKPKTLSKSRR